MRLSWIPNSLSMGNLFLGFLAIIFSANHSHVTAAFCILLAGIFDLMDGRIARKINQPNPIGKELDSLADLVTFGIAPGFMFFTMCFGAEPVYPSAISDLTGLGAVISFLFPLSGALRLAKFNIAETQNLFTGMPSTIAGMSCALFLVFDDMPHLLKLPIISDFKFGFPWWGAMAIFLIYAILMNSKILFTKFSPSLLNFSKENSLSKKIVSILLVIAVVIFWKYLLILLTIFYTVSAILTHKRRAREVTS